MDNVKTKYTYNDRPCIPEDLYTFEHSHSSGQLFGFNHSQNPSIFYIMDKFFTLNPKLRYVVEIGTGGGAQTLQYAIWCKVKRPGAVISLYDGDIANYMTIEQMQFLSNFVQLINQNAYDEMSIGLVKSFVDYAHINNGEVLIFCDGRSREQEFELYSTVGADYLMLHDYGRELKVVDHEKAGYHQYMQADFDNLKTDVLSLRNDKLRGVE